MPSSETHFVTLISFSPRTNNFAFLLYFKVDATLLNKQSPCQDKGKVSGVPSRMCLGGFMSEACP